MLSLAAECPRIALIDDDTLTIKMLEMLLSHAGYQTLCCYSGADGVELVKKEQPDLVILDMQMEQRDSGLVALQALRLDPNTEKIPAIICSADGLFLREKEQQLRAHNCGILEKPFMLDELLSIIGTMIPNPQSQAQHPL